MDQSACMSVAMYTMCHTSCDSFAQARACGCSEKMQKARNSSMLKTNEAYRQGSSQTSAKPAKSMGTREKNLILIDDWLTVFKFGYTASGRYVSKCPLKNLHGFLPDLNHRLGSIADYNAYPLIILPPGFNFFNPAGPKSKKYHALDASSE